MAHPRVNEVLWTHIGGGRAEGLRLSIYVDRLGLPTVGVGNYLRTADQVRQFRWFQGRNGPPADINAVVHAWQEYAPTADGAPSAAGVAAAGGVGGQTVIPQFATDEPSIHNVFTSMFTFCEGKAVEAMTSATWLHSPADAQLAIILHLWRTPNELHQARYAPFRDALVRRDWWEAFRLTATHGFRPPRQGDLQLAFSNAALLEQAHAEDSSVDTTILHFPNVYAHVSRTRWPGVAASA